MLRFFSISKLGFASTRCIFGAMDIKSAIELLDSGELVAIPTETVYGLAGNAFNPAAISRIFTLKQRPTSNPLIVHIAEMADMFGLAKDIPNEAFQLAQTFWPGPLTMILPKQSKVPAIVTGNQDTVALRVPNHPLTLELLKELDYPLAAPSANLYKTISPTKPAHVQKYFGKNFPILDGGICASGLESTIVGFKNKQTVIYRHGIITADDIFEATKQKVVDVKGNIIKTPGGHKQHYSPNTPFYYSGHPEALINDLNHEKIAFIKFSKNQFHFNKKVNEVCFDTSKNLNHIARQLYATLHDLDDHKYDAIVAEKIRPEGIGAAIHDKLNRAQNTQKI